MRRTPLVRLAAPATFGLILLIMLAIGTVCLIDAIGWIGKPFAGFLVYKYPVVGSYADHEWSGMQAGIRYRDVILEVNGQKVFSSVDIERVVGETRIGDPVRYRIDRKGERVHLDVPVVRFRLKDFLQIFALTFLGGLIFWSIGAIVYFIKPNTPATWAFLLFCLFLGTYFVSGFAVQTTHYAFWNYLNRFSMSLFPAAALHLSLLFPERTSSVQKWPKIQLLPYLISLLPMISHHLDLVALTRAHLDTEAFISVSSRLLRTLQFTRLYAFLAAIAVVGASGYAYWRSQSVIARQRARVVLLGSAVAFLPATIAMPLAAVTRLLIPFNLLAVPVIAFPAAIGYAVARHNLFDVDVYVKRAVGYGIMTTIVGVTYFGVQTLTNTVVLTPVFGDYRESVYPLVFAVLVVFLFNPIQRRVQDVVDRVFFRKQFDYKGTITSVSNALTSMLNLEQIATQVVQTIRQEMFVDAAGVIVVERQKQTCKTFFLEPVGYDDPLLALARSEKALITRYAVEEDPRYAEVKQACLQTFTTLGASLAIPLVSQGEVAGLLAVGQKKSGKFYSRDDVDLLTTMAAQAAVAIENATTHEEVVRYAEELATSLRRIQILESIKSNLAKFVPKTVQELIEESPEAPSFDKREADVSVVFADITGYTRLSAQMEFEQVNRLVERYFGAFLDEIMKFGGDVNETAGDGLMVIFRNPDPRRHARAAVLAALGIQCRTREINTELAGEFEPIAMHVGVNSGIASVGATKIEGVAGTRWTYTASGPTTNIASRLAALGEAGAVVLSDETRHRLGDEFEVEDLGPRALKNVDRPVQVYRITAGQPPAGRALDERRRHPRHPLRWRVRVWIGEDSFEGQAVDASTFGICVAGVPMALLNVDQSYDIEIVTESGSQIRCVATVRDLTDRGVGLETKEALPGPV